MTGRRTSDPQPGCRFCGCAREDANPLHPCAPGKSHTFGPTPRPRSGDAQREVPDFADTLAEIASLTDRERRDRDGWRETLHAAWKGGYRAGYAARLGLEGRRSEAAPSAMDRAFGIAPDFPEERASAEAFPRVTAEDWRHLAEMLLVTKAAELNLAEIRDRFGLDEDRRERDQASGNGGGPVQDAARSTPRTSGTTSMPAGAPEEAGTTCDCAERLEPYDKGAAAFLRHPPSDAPLTDAEMEYGKGVAARLAAGPNASPAPGSHVCDACGDSLGGAWFAVNGWRFCSIPCEAAKDTSDPPCRHTRGADPTPSKAGNCRTCLGSSFDADGSCSDCGDHIRATTGPSSACDFCGTAKAGPYRRCCKQGEKADATPSSSAGCPACAGRCTYLGTFSDGSSRCADIEGHSGPHFSNTAKYPVDGSESAIVECWLIGMSNAGTAFERAAARLFLDTQFTREAPK